MAVSVIRAAVALGLLALTSCGASFYISCDSFSYSSGCSCTASTSVIANPGLAECRAASGDVCCASAGYPTRDGSSCSCNPDRVSCNSSDTTVGACTSPWQ